MDSNIYDPTTTVNTTPSENSSQNLLPSSGLAPLDDGIQTGDLYNNNGTYNSPSYETTSSNNGSTSTDGSSMLTGSYWSDHIGLLYSVLDYSSSTAVIIGCLLPYVPQYCTIYRDRNCSGFSTYVCLTQLIANILRIAFWFGHPFELPLLIQSCVMITGQLLLLELCVRVKSNNSRKEIKLLKGLRYFWRWTNIISYLEFLALFTIIIAGIMYVLIRYQQVALIEAIGFMSLIIESMLGIPQLIKNYRKKSVLGMSLGMVFMWLLGDLYKTAYFVLRDTPKQFWLCGALQVTIDLLILCQVCIYRKKANSILHIMSL